jgi:hypothetical protein
MLISKLNLMKPIAKIDIIPQDIGRVLLNLINNAFYAVDEKQKKTLTSYQTYCQISTIRNSHPPSTKTAKGKNLYKRQRPRHSAESPGKNISTLFHHQTHRAGNWA